MQMKAAHGKAQEAIYRQRFDFFTLRHDLSSQTKESVCYLHKKVFSVSLCSNRPMSNEYTGTPWVKGTAEEMRE